MIHYVLGFMLNKSLDKVVMIKKNKPELLSGKINGVGGKIDDVDYGFECCFTPEVYAMAREFHEEVGIDTALSQWHPIGLTEGFDYSIAIFVTIGDVDKAITVTDEEVFVIDVDDVYMNIDKCCPYVYEYLKKAVDYCKRFR